MTSSLALALLWQLSLEPSAARAPITRVENGEPTVAITFDACATRTQGYGFDRAIFDLLRTENVPATIFVSGRWVEAHPEVMGELAADALIEFGDHSYDHPHMRKLTAERMGEQIDQTEAALGRYGKKSVAFRPPFGEWNPRVLEVVQGRNLPAVLWDVVSGDPSANMTAPAMIKTVLRKTRPGSIVIFHINGRAHKTAEALPVILRELRARGLRFVHLSQLLAGGPPPALTPPPLVAPPLLEPPLVPSPSPIAPPLPKSPVVAAAEPAPWIAPPPAAPAVAPAVVVARAATKVESRAAAPPAPKVGPDDPLPLSPFETMRALPDSVGR
jgi:peptidoglycan/xylan/chitin deacetylase (PgdA/CDA1 family)